MGCGDTIVLEVQGIKEINLLKLYRGNVCRIGKTFRYLALRKRTVTILANKPGNEAKPSTAKSMNFS